MENIVHRASDVDEGGNVVVDKLEIWIVREMGQIGEIAGEEIVDNKNAVAGRQKPVAEMRTEEAGAAGYNRSGFGISHGSHQGAVNCG